MQPEATSHKPKEPEAKGHKNKKVQKTNTPSLL